MNQEYTRAPHRRTSPEAPPLHNAALLIDFDNVTMGIRSNLGQELRNLLESDVIRGKVAVQRAYADWRRYPQYIVPLSESSIDLIFAPAYGSSKKNATDIRLAIDALELVFTRPEIGTFILLSGDSDFSSLVLKLKEYGKYVIGVGLQESTSDILVQNCDEYYSYNRLSGLITADEMQTVKHDPWELLQKALQRMVDRGDVMRSDRLKQVMLEIDPSFDEKTAGFTKFNRFLAEGAQRELVRVRKGENGQYEVVPGDRKVTSPTVSERGGGGDVLEQRSPRGRRGRRGGRSGRGRDRGPRSERATSSDDRETASGDGRDEAATEGPDDAARGSLGDAAPQEALAEAYDALAEVVEELFRNGGAPVRDSMAKRKLLARDASFDEASLGFSKFSRFLRQANDEGIVDLNKGEDGNFYLTPVAGADAHPSRRRDRKRDETREGGSRSRDSRRGGGRKGGETARDAAEPARAEGRGGRDSGEPADASPLAAAAAAARRTLGRFRRGSRAPSPHDSREQRSGIGPVPDAKETPPPAETPPSDRRAASTERASAAGEPEAREKTEARPDRRPQAGHDEPSRVQRDERRGRRGTGSGRSGTGSRARPADSVEAASPRTKAESSTTAASAGSPTEPRAPAVREVTPSTPAEPKGMGRFRAGSRGRTGPAPKSDSPKPRIGPVPESELGGTKRGAEETPTTSDAGESGAPRDEVEPQRSPPEPPSHGEGGGSDPVDYMVRNYPGVGKRTAEALVDRFGEEVFEVIDREPDRLTEVLSEGRARAVLEARKAEQSG